jgi:hypothetical protein
MEGVGWRRTVLREEEVQQAANKLQAQVLEREGGAMKEFQNSGVCARTRTSAAGHLDYVIAPKGSKGIGKHLVEVAPRHLLFVDEHCQYLATETLVETWLAAHGTPGE